MQAETMHDMEGTLTTRAEDCLFSLVRSRGEARVNFWRRATGLAPDLVALTALVVPFAYHTSPLAAITGNWPDPEWGLVTLAAPLFLAFPIVVWQLRRNLGVGATAAESALAVVFSAAAMAALPIGAYASRERLLAADWSVLEMLGTAAFAALMLVNISVLAVNVARKRPREVTIGALLHGAYPPHAVLLLCEFAAHWNIGALAVAASCLAYVVRIVRLLTPAPH